MEKMRLARRLGSDRYETLLPHETMSMGYVCSLTVTPVTPLTDAAPDMFPLVEVLAALPIGPNTSDDVPLYGLDGVYITHGHVRAARAALAKARGET